MAELEGGTERLELDSFELSWGSVAGRSSSRYPGTDIGVVPAAAAAYEAVLVVNRLLSTPLTEEDLSRIRPPPLSGGGLFRVICVNATSALERPDNRPRE